ncbi:cytochrome c oxidase assembly protein [Zhihengliuella halotolerans]|uniref:Putative copper resistance protein D n=1 Tax=Zhihengliuella halotolerans TaxID=370736 RepID=A0A4Q8AFQ0_9MICC|nr:cytochrome c oxidase assembly protein [Zhihengliuella halotolerans]RZU62459.1 putative copper resistance protein D [Zhihengliuella halotolerans]
MKPTQLTVPAFAAGLVALVAALLYTGAAAAGTLADPGAVTRWGLPLARTVHHTAMATSIGALVFAAAILPRGLKPTRADADAGGAHPAFERAMNVAAGAATVWTLSAAAVLVLTFSDVSGLPVAASDAYTSGMLDFILNIGTGQAWAWMIVIAAITATWAFGVRAPAGIGLGAVFAMIGILPLSLIGHAGGADDHWAAVNGMLLHLAGVCLWVGGIAVLACLAGTLDVPAPGRAPGAGKQTTPVLTGVVLRRFSWLATVAILLVAVSGVISAALRVSEPSDLTTPYGMLIVVKTALTLLLAALGWMHRQLTIPHLLAGKLTAAKAAWRIVGVEAAIMAVVMAVAAVLGRTAPPVPQLEPESPSPARYLTGYELPGELTASSWVTEWRFDWLWVAIVAILAAFYVIGFVTVRRRGDSWPVIRLVCWFVGLAALFYITSGVLAVYGMVLFSSHMIGHMALTMVAPFFLVIGAPVTLALKAVPARTDGTRGPREWILAIVHSWFSKLVTNPLFAAANFAGSIIIFYNTDLFYFALSEHVGHELMNVHFLLTGYIFALNMIGSDPLPRRAPYPFRLVILLATMSFHAFYGVSIMSSESLMQASWFGNMGREWGASPMEDQKFGAGAMWGIGEVPTLLLALGVMFQWSRSSEREAKRTDRKAERDDDAELAAYNAMFSQLKEHDEKRDIRGR